MRDGAGGARLKPLPGYSQSEEGVRPVAVRDRAGGACYGLLGGGSQSEEGVWPAAVRGPAARDSWRSCGSGAATAEFDEATKEAGKSSPDPFFFFSTSACF